jgi:hypothetical protein
VNAVVIEASQIQISALLVDEVTQDISQPADFQEIVGVPDELHLMASAAIELKRLRAGYKGTSHFSADGDSPAMPFGH